MIAKLKMIITYYLVHPCLQGTQGNRSFEIFILINFKIQMIHLMKLKHL